MYCTVQLNSLYTPYNEKHYIKELTHSPDITHVHVLYSPCNSSVIKCSNLASAILGPFLCGKRLSFLGLIKCVTSSSPVWGKKLSGVEWSGVESWSGVCIVELNCNNTQYMYTQEIFKVH